MTNKTILVTGGAGYIGSVTSLQLVEEGYNVVILDNMLYGNKKNIEAIESLSNKKIHFHEGDIRDTNTLDELFTKYKPDVVMHFAALISVPESVAKPLEYYDTNVTGTINILKIAKKHSIKHFIFSSTAAVFGNSDVNPLTETSPTVPINPYGESKLIIENLLKSMSESNEMNSVAFRYFNASGAHPSALMGGLHVYHLVTVLMQVVLGKRKEITIFGSDYPTKDGTCVRDYIHVCDLASAHVLGVKYLLERKNDKCVAKRYNLGNGTGYSVNEVVEACRKVTSHPIPAINGERRAGDPPSLTACSKLAKEELGWTPKYADIETIVKHSYQYHLESSK